MKTGRTKTAASSQGRWANSGNGIELYPVDIDHPVFTAVVSPDTAFWALVDKSELAGVFSDDHSLYREYRQKAEVFEHEMNALRSGQKPSAVYVNPTERCNLDCSYCYIPGEMRKDGRDMPKEELIDALGRMKRYFRRNTPEDYKPEVIFHGSEPMLNREAVFTAIDYFSDDFRFGVQTNGTLLDRESADFLMSRGVGIGFSLDAPEALLASRTRKTWSGDGVYDSVVQAIELVKGYDRYSVICTVTKENMAALVDMVDFFHAMEVPVCMLNPVRCTRVGGRMMKPDDAAMANYYLKALDRTHELYRETGRKLVVANFANILLAVLAPTARKLMCDISPCGGGRCFVALSAKGDLFPCSEFVGLPEFNGGSVFHEDIDDVLEKAPFRKVTGRMVEDIEPCNRCAIRHFCGSPCPAEAYSLHGTMQSPGAFCELYEEQVRYAMRLIADGKADDFLEDNWENSVETVFDLALSSPA
ncbi:MULTISPECIES: peptide-modifying radical SAM enzyme CbpB [Prosthecochloris]|uniref:Peptide-modifying radical SAM enzyme CbpB n=1 Tax=Prosthecochloris marina TaxID=2017681 RepID=A0A317T935_9CHLB|nr:MULTISPECIES: peptide-modifying radical SAM enzyme CbpB [Prosthecochloris]PWW82860.1 peptide-modifying radical SAM enzyme CbpB [Prosthecochloris marina]UZJ37848.1 peptide-modifying radical SAM enzyme CbpB [Prosthecochloris sp. SCSIO W1103]